MATKYRQDLTAVDFRILKRFKHHLLSLGTEHTCPGVPTVINPKIHLTTSEENVFIQYWYFSTLGWEEYVRKKCVCLCYILKVSDFRTVVHRVSGDIPKTTEGLVLHILKKFSILFFDDNGNWKRKGIGGAEIWLEYRRLSPDGQIKKRNFQTAAAKKEKIDKLINDMMESRGVDREVAVKILSPSGITPEYLGKLKEECDQNEIRKLQIRERINEFMRQR